MPGTPERKWTNLRSIPPRPTRDAGDESAGPVDEPVDGEACGEVEAPVKEMPHEIPASPVVLGERDDEASVLVAHPTASTTRLIRETLEQFTGARVFTTADPLRAFELSLQRSYRIFVFAMQFEDLSGPMLYELISKACAAGRGARILAPGVVFIREKDDPRLPDSLSRDVRVKDVLSKPVRIERLLESVGGALEVRDPTLRN